MSKQKLITILILAALIIFAVFIVLVKNGKLNYGPNTKTLQGNLSLTNEISKNMNPTSPVLFDSTGFIGRKDDLVYFSIMPNTKVSNIISYRGKIKGGWFFEGNLLINVLDMNKKSLLKSNAVAKSEWMTAGPVDFEGNIDFSNLQKGKAYIEIHNDNASGIKEKDKSILVPITIE